MFETDGVEKLYQTRIICETCETLITTPSSTSAEAVENIGVYWGRLHKYFFTSHHVTFGVYSYAT